MTTPVLVGLPEKIGDYRILRKIGEGGMGVVYEAEQQNPRRAVAIKVIRGGRQVDEHQVRLFQREAQTLARLRHAGIATIYESGRTEEGQHFFAMELVRGETLTRHLKKQVAEQRSAPDELRRRLMLFRRICEAVSYAHQRAVIHRDLKPSNILVGGDSDGPGPLVQTVPNVKILDFGLARIADTDVAVTTMHTEIGKVQGTLPYMSPEQVSGNPDEIDVRSDVYSLGVILYEMLTGHLPHDLKAKTLPEAVRVITQEPPKPLRHTWSGTHRLDADLATITLAALEKEPSRRYQSASGLAQDVERYLSNHPILARPPSAIYQIRKLIVRHKAVFGTAVALLLSLAGFAVTMALQAERIARERDRANLEAETSRQVSEFLKGLFRISNPYEGKGASITAREILDRGAAKITGELRGQPLVQARLMTTMGDVYRELGLFEEARPLLARALAIREGILQNGLEVAESLNSLGLLDTNEGRLTEAVSNLERAHGIRERILGLGHVDVGFGLYALGMALGRKGDHQPARHALERALAIFEKELDPDDPFIGRCITNLGNVEFMAGNVPAAARLFERAIQIKERRLGPEDPDVAETLNNLGFALTQMGDYARAETLLRRASAIFEKAFGSDHPKTAMILHSLADLLRLQGRNADARSLLERALAIQEARLSPGDPDIALVHNSLAHVLEALGDPQLAEQHFRRALAIREKALGAADPAVAETLEGYAALLRKARRDSEAAGLEARAREIRTIMGGEGAGRSGRIPAGPRAGAGAEGS